MQIGVDGRIAAQAEGTGVSSYGTVLATTLSQAGFEVQPLVEGRRRGRPARWLSAALHPGAWPAPLGPPGRRVVGDVFRIAQVRFDIHRRFLTLRDGAAPPALMHWTYPLPLHFAAVPNVYTVHDLIPLLHPGLTPIAAPRLRRLLARLRHHAAHLVTVSEASRQDIIRELGWPPDQVTNTYQAVARAADLAPVALAKVLAPLGLRPGGFVLCAGSVEPRKNVRRLAEAHRASGIAAPLVVAGPDGWRAAEELAGHAGRPGLIRLPWVERSTLLALMQAARIVAVPSLAEGFGLVIAEAMALGTPVITSRGGATEEVAGGAALLVDARDGRALAEGLRALDGAGALRTELAARGRRRSALFTPAAYADRLRAVYGTLTDRSPFTSLRAAN